jgi:histidinol-phosphate aminotransferase
MPKVFPHIPNITRINTLYSPIDKIRLHASERSMPFENEIMDCFLSKIKETDVRYYPNMNNGYVTLSKIAHINEQYLTMYDGSSTGIRHIFQAFGNGNIVSAEPSFPMYKVYADILGLNYISCEYDGFEFPYQSILDNINEDTAIVLLSNPSTPFGYNLDDNYVRDIWLKCAKNDCLLLIDEAYIDFSNNQSYECLARQNNNLIVLRTLSKGFGSAGMRIGYSVSSKSNNEILRKVSNLNDISSIAIKWLETVDECYSYFRNYIQIVKANRDGIMYELCNNGYKFIVSDSNFINVEELQLSDIFVYKYYEYNGKNIARFSIPAVINDYSLLLKDIRERK